MLTHIHRTAIVWTAVGLAGGLFYREFTKLNDVAGGTQLAVVHTHALTLGTIVMLILFALVGQWRTLPESRSFRIGFWTWQAGLTLTTLGLLVKGSLQVLEHESANSPAIAGVSGLGHMTLTAAFILFLVALAPVARAGSASSEADRAEHATAGPVGTTVR